MPKDSNELPALPIDDLIPEAIGLLRENGRLVLEAAPGAGKTTRLPLALLRAGFDQGGEIIVLQPRRIAARAAAEHVAHLMGEPLGERCGYRVRFEGKSGPRTRLLFVTEGILARRLRDDPSLRGVATVVLDEFHERSLDADLNLALLRRLQDQRRNEGKAKGGEDKAKPAAPLNLVIMSATLDAGVLAGQLGWPLLQSEGRQYPVEVIWRPGVRPRGQAGKREPFLEKQVALAVRAEIEACAGLTWETEVPHDGHILVFLPGVGELERAARACQALAQTHDLDIHLLHGGLASSEQRRALLREPGDRPRRKLILATNVAETSLTIEGVRSVIDSGLARRARHDPWSGLPILEVAKISQASAIQRAGRAGRNAPGRCVRLYSESDFSGRPTRDLPELQRLDLTGALLDLYAAGVTSPDHLAWLEPPPENSLRSAEDLLRSLAALTPTTEERGTDSKAQSDPSKPTELKLSDLGRKMVRIPLHPRLARLLLEGVRLGISDDAASAAALLSEGPLVRGPDRALADVQSDADVLVEMELLTTLAGRSDRARQHGIDSRVLQQVERVRRQLVEIVRRFPRPEAAVESSSRSRAKPDRGVVKSDENLLKALLVAYPDRVARVRGEPGERRSLVVVGGQTASLAEASALGPARWALALALQQHRAGARSSQSIVRSAARIDVDWLIDLFADEIEERMELAFDSERERVEGYSLLVYRGLTIERSKARGKGDAMTAVLREAALARGAKFFIKAPASLSSWVARVALCHGHKSEFPLLDYAAAERCLAELCENKTSFAELHQANLMGHLEGLLAARAHELEALCPTSITIPGRRRLPIHYEPGKPPSCSARLQDFFGLHDAPRILDQSLPLVLHLLAPNKRAVQVTTDLAGFWERHYPALRKSLMRRYPRHAWPEDPLAMPAGRK